MIAADSTVRNTVARLIASFQISDRVASRLQCSVARIWAACGPNGRSVVSIVDLLMPLGAAHASS